MLVSVNETCELLGISRATLYVLMARGDFVPAIKLGRRTLFRREALETWVREREAA